MADLRFDLLGEGDYARAKAVLNAARHPGFVGREAFFRWASKGRCWLAVVDDGDAGVALIDAAGKLQALSVARAHQGRGVGQALMAHAKPKWVSAIVERVEWFRRLGYESVGAAEVGASGKTATQLMQRVGGAVAALAVGPIRAGTYESPENSAQAEPEPTVEGTDALVIAQIHAPEAIKRVITIMRAPTRGAGIALAAARIVLDVAGVGAAAADRRHAELLTVLRGKLSQEAHAEVLRALAECTGQREDADPDAAGDERNLQ